MAATLPVSVRELPHRVALRIHGAADLPTLIYLPGLHGDWTLVASFRAELKGRVRFAEISYPRRPEWKLNEYACAVLDELKREHIAHGWLLGESFSSQVVWKILELVDRGATDFHPHGVILAGGFVRHPVILGVHCFHAIHCAMPLWLCRALLRVYAAYARLRHRHAPETLVDVTEFVQRRTAEDLKAIGSRYPIIASNDLRPIARHTAVPVYQLTGFFDPIVPWPFVRRWLRHHCRGYRETRVIFNADHNVLGTAPKKAAEQVIEWVQRS